MHTFIRRIAALLFSFTTLFTSFRLQFLPERNLYPTTGEQVRVMSFNLRYDGVDDHGKQAAQLIGEYYPDSIGVQECTYQWKVMLNSKLPDYTLVGVGRDTGTRLIGCGEMSAILYRTDKYQAIDSGTFWLSETPDIPSKSWDSDCNRICTWVVLENRQTGERYAHVNTHLDHRSANARKNGLAMVLDKVKSFDIPVVLTGDFNFYESSTLFSSFSDAGLTYTKAAAANSDSGCTFHDNDPDSCKDDSPFDYIWVNSGIASVNTYKIIRDKLGGEFVSDHYPIYADIVLK